MGIRCADHVTPLYPQKLALTWPTGGGRSVGIVRSRTKATEFFNTLKMDAANFYRNLGKYLRINTVSYPADVSLYVGGNLEQLSDCRRQLKLFVYCPVHHAACCLTLTKS